MNVFAAIEHRREITSFKPDPIPQADLDRLIASLYLSPSGNNLPSREFIVVTDRDMLKQLTPTTPYMKWLEHAAAGVVIIAKQSLSKYWLQDASIAGGYAWLTAVSMGLGAAWGAVYHAEDDEECRRREAYVRDNLGIPEDYRVVAILGFGYPAAEPPKKTMYPIEQVLHRERY